MQVYFTSDLHLGHKSICKYRTKFTSSADHDEYIFSLFDSLNKRSILYILGDFLFSGQHFDSYIERLKSYPFQFRIVIGNHDSKQLYSVQAPNISVELPLFQYKSMWLSHCPIHPSEMRDRIGNVHGHLHLQTLDDPLYYNVNLDVNNYQLVPLETIKSHFKEHHAILSQSSVI